MLSVWLTQKVSLFQSVAGVLPLQLQAAYSAAKSGLINLTQSMGLELGKQGILCNAIAPGTIATAGTAGLWVRPNPPPLPRPHPSRAQRFDVATLVCFRRVR